ncbi:MAG: NAD-dependent epimerase/dehydratase family protein [Pseudonocardiaceae bacterium]
MRYLRGWSAESSRLLLVSYLRGSLIRRGDGVERRAVVVGGAGFVGSHVCERLLTDGYDVVCIGNFVAGSPTTCPPRSPGSSTRSVRG